jgi:hypothetical protein
VNEPSVNDTRANALVIAREMVRFLYFAPARRSGAERSSLSDGFLNRAQAAWFRLLASVTTMQLAAEKPGSGGDSLEIRVFNVGAAH